MTTAESSSGPAADPVGWDDLRAAAAAVANQAYAPYSRLHVGAAVRTAAGDIVTGCNVENASYGLTLCAECGVVSELHRGGHGPIVAVCASTPEGTILLPCGRCRQLLMEHGGPDLLVDTPDGPVPLDEILPHAFGAGDLPT